MKLSTVLVIITSYVTLGSARTGFAKDENEDLIEFPPTVLRRFDDSGIPVGHLRPLGWQSEPSGEVTEQTSMTDALQFNEQFVELGRPVVFRRAVHNASAMKNWIDNKYLIDKYGSIPVDVVVKKELLSTGPQRMLFHKFLKQFTHENWYLSNYIPLEMMHELHLPRCLSCGFSAWLMESELWMSSGGTSSLLHSHADHDLHCVIAGRKDFILVQRQFKHVFHFVDRGPFVGAGRSELDMDRVNMFKYADISQVPWTWSTLRAGDCIFIPAGYLHQVRSYGRSISSTNHFAPSPDLNFTDCVSSASSVAPLSLSKVQFMWSYVNGYLLLSDEKLTPAAMRHHLLMTMRNNTQLNFDVFDDFYQQTMLPATDFPDVSEVWNVLVASVSPQNSLSRRDVQQVDDNVMNKLADVFNLPRRQVADSFRRVKHTEL